MVGLGNGLSAYSYYYLISMYNRETFDFAKSMKSIKWKNKAQEMLKLMKKDQILKNLPLVADCNDQVKVDPSIAISESIDFCGLFYHMKMYGILENIHLLRPILLKALKSYTNKVFDFHQNDVVIHVRTGDIFSNKHEAFYSSIHFSNYVDILKHRTVNKIYIVWKSERVQDKAFDTYNNAVIKHLREYLCENLNLLQENVVYENQSLDDFVFMTQAPLLISCISTYSMWAALLNTNESILPQCKNQFNYRLYKGDHFEIVPMTTVCKYKKDLTEFCNQFTEHH